MGHADGFHRYELTLRPLECVKLAERLGTCEQHFFPFFPVNNAIVSPSGVTFQLQVTLCLQILFIFCMFGPT